MISILGTILCVLLGTQSISARTITLPKPTGSHTGALTSAISWKKITNITQIQSVLQNADAETLVVFDVDYVIIAPKDLLGRPKAKSVRQPIFQEYKDQYGKKRVQEIWINYMIQGERELVEPEVKNIIDNLKADQISTIALTAIGTQPVGPVQDPIKQRLQDLNQQGISFNFVKASKAKQWAHDSGFYQGIIFSGKQDKGEALQYYIEHIHTTKIKQVVFVDDDERNVESVIKMCEELGLECHGFHYVAEVFEKDPPLNPELARLQIKTLDQQKIWMPDEKAKKTSAKKD